MVKFEPERKLLREYLRVAPLSRALIRSEELGIFLERSLGGRVLDLGYGDGIFGELLIRHGFTSSVGIDHSLDELKKAKKRKSCPLIAADMERLPFRDGVFATAISNCVLEHIDDIDRALSEARRVLRPGGVFAASVVTDRYEDLLFWPTVFRKLRLEKFRSMYLAYVERKMYHRRYFTVNQWIETVRRNDLEVSDIQHYVSSRKQKLMDLFLPFVLLSRIIENITGRPVIIRGRWPGFVLSVLLGRRREEKAFANLFFIARRPGGNTRE